MVKRFLIIAVICMIPSMAFAGTGYIPIWQHGLGVTYFNNMINTDTKAVLCEINLIDVSLTTTYNYSQMVAPSEAWVFDTADEMRMFGFGWGFMTSTGDPGTTFGWGAVYGTLSGKIAGLTVLVPESGF